MTTINININDNLFNFKSNKSGKKSEKPKQGRADKMRRTDDYLLKKRNAERRKQTKGKYNTTHRREEQPDARDVQLEEIHFANFLGLKDIKYGGIPYNNTHIDMAVNLWECDILRPEEEELEQEMIENDDDSYNYGIQDEEEWIRQISREPNTKLEMRWNYEPETQTLSGESYFKRGLDEEVEDEQSNKRAKEQKQEEAIFESMVAYMRQQLELAQEMIDADELFVCDCKNK
jgi:hypothetical protein